MIVSIQVWLYLTAIGGVENDKRQGIFLSLYRMNSPITGSQTHVACFYIQNGNLREAMNIVEKLVQVNASRQLQYYDLLLDLASRLGDTDKLGELIPKILNSSYNADVLFQFSQMLDDRGFTQHAIAMALKASH